MTETERNIEYRTVLMEAPGQYVADVLKSHSYPDRAKSVASMLGGLFLRSLQQMPCLIRNPKFKDFREE